MYIFLKKTALFVLAIVVVLAFTLPIKMKQAINIEIMAKDTTMDINSFIGQIVTLLCEYSDHEITEPPDYEFNIIAIANENGVFEPLPLKRDDKITGIAGLYVYPKHFIGDSIKKYNFGYRNHFVFCGILSEVTARKNGNNWSSYEINLKSWDIVYPVLHWELHLLWPRNEFYKQHIFLFDYLI